ncbi:hypothetical protein [Sorangium sp. So ce233]|uniref:hypothetical protein n=1 Tax=Sorangium sp. So ce233 TaxID=3133290 RepID=UPI003F6319EB
MTAPLPYVGISGVTTRAEALAALAAFPDCGRDLMVGALASEKTLAGQQNRWWRRYPKVESIAGVFIDDPRCLNLVHYGADTPPDAATLLRLFELGGPLCHGVQFNGCWPEPANLEAFCRRFERAGRTPRIVLQLGACPAGLSGVAWADARLAPYADRRLITDVLIDASGGTGKPLAVDRARELFAGLRSPFPHLGIGVAGGLFAETVPQIARLLQAGASVDAESGLRDGADGGGRLDMARVKTYLAAAGEAVRS